MNADRFNQPVTTPGYELPQIGRRTRPNAMQSKLDSAIAAASAWLFDRQQPSGFWCANFEGDTTLEAYTIMLETFLGRRTSDITRKLARVIRAEVLAGGGWSQYDGGPADLSVSCLSYLALKLVGDSSNDLI